MKINKSFTKSCCAPEFPAKQILEFINGKYFNLFIATIENLFFADGLTGVERASGIFSGVGTGALGLEQIVLPVGISFFTFQALSYVIDVFNDDAEFQDNLGYFALYISCFPQLIAGPIVHYKDIATQLSDRKVG